MTFSYEEGTWFAVPLRTRGLAVGLVARATPEGRVILCYYFGPIRTDDPRLADLKRVRPIDAILVARTGDLSLMNGDWPVIGLADNWVRSQWPIPFFVRCDELSGKSWCVEYADHDPTEAVRETPIEEECALRINSVYGSGAIEIVLTRLLSETIEPGATPD